jgi:hypothetical protein
MATVHITYKGAAPVLVPDAGLTVSPGDTVSIDAELAASLLARPQWVKAKEKAAKESE